MTGGPKGTILESSQATSAMHHSVASTFNKFRYLVHFISLDAEFIQRFAKVRKKSVKMPIVQPLLPRMRVSSMDILARIHNSPAEKHGDKHALPSSQLRHIGSFKKGTECVIREDFSIEGFGSSPDCLPSTDEVIQFIDHFILLN